MSIEEIIKKDRKIEWYLFISREREYSPLFGFLALTSQYPKEWLHETIGVDFEFRYLKRVGNGIFWSVEDYTNLRKLFNDKAKKAPLYLIKIIKKAEAHCDRLFDWCHKTRNKSGFEEKTNPELREILKEYWNLQKKAASFLFTKHNLNLVLEQKIKNKISKYVNVKEADLYFEKILIPTKKTLTTRANEKLLKISSEKNRQKSFIRKWLAEYNWIETFTWLGKKMTEPDAVNGIKRLKQKRKNKKHSEEYNLGKVNYFNDKNLKLLTKALQDLLYLHTYELECLFASNYWCENMIKEISRRIGLTFEEYHYAIYPEIISALKGAAIDRKKILSRKNNQCAILRFKENTTILEGDDFKRIISFKKEIINYGKIKGNAAFGGRARGYVKIIKTIKDFNGFKKGNIVVSPMTTTDFTQYISNASAIITNEGGITCHAAIVSREFSIPCIVGTKTATVVLHDGDFVEVDANKGIVKILKRN